MKNDAAEIVRDGRTVRTIPAEEAERPRTEQDTFLQILGRIEGHLEFLGRVYADEENVVYSVNAIGADVEALKAAHNVMQYEMSIERSKR